MTNISNEETYYETTVTYTLEREGRFYIIENVPARVCVETGERLFSPEIVEKLQEIIWENKPPQRLIQTPVYEFSSV
ncbi:YgiT-type zinc finger protein [Crocosphaera chwakensis]|uniref:Uncharacterized protein n=1 Tax=Crocosphaera chwakensis CCY0110 TaxID=391612 RepID=A3INA9_9CHRO|nr:YgiT-type zinc finger protein [Crocosphaera chwakensis]EAZ92086.1 hypothetical protein CY0110_00470 [Crocosphaera chwakensis CCY0110]